MRFTLHFTHSQSSNYVKTVFIVVTVKNISVLWKWALLSLAGFLKLKLLWLFVMMSLHYVSKWYTIVYKYYGYCYYRGRRPNKNPKDILFCWHNSPLVSAAYSLIMSSTYVYGIFCILVYCGIVCNKPQWILLHISQLIHQSIKFNSKNELTTTIIKINESFG